MKKKLTMCRTNKEALRWCKTNKVTIQFDNWKDTTGDSHIPPGTTCAVVYEVGDKHVKRCIDKSLMSAVNKLIKDKNDCDKKMGIVKKSKALK